MNKDLKPVNEYCIGFDILVRGGKDTPWVRRGLRGYFEGKSKEGPYLVGTKDMRFKEAKRCPDVRYGDDY